MTNEEWLTQKFTDFANWVEKHAKCIAIGSWCVVGVCLAFMYIKQSLMPIAVILPTAIIGAGTTSKCVTDWLDAEHKGRNLDETKQL